MAEVTAFIRRLAHSRRCPPIMMIARRYRRYAASAIYQYHREEMTSEMRHTDLYVQRVRRVSYFYLKRYYFASFSSLKYA